MAAGESPAQQLVVPTSPNRSMVIDQNVLLVSAFHSFLPFDWNSLEVLLFFFNHVDQTKSASFPIFGKYLVYLCPCVDIFIALFDFFINFLC